MPEKIAPFLALLETEWVVHESAERQRNELAIWQHRRGWTEVEGGQI